MEFLMGLWNFFNYNIFSKPAFFIGIIVFIGYLLLKRPFYMAFAGFIKATVGYLILSEGSGGLVNNFRPILVGLNERFHMSAAVIDPYYGQIAAENLIVEVGRSVSLGMSVLILGFFINILLVALKRFTKIRSLMITGHTMVCQCSLVVWLVLFAFPEASDLSIIICTGILMGVYWGATTNLTVEACQELTDGAGFVVGHNQMFGVWAAYRLSGKIGKGSKSVDELKLPGWLSIFSDNVVSSGVLMILFFGILMSILGPDLLHEIDSGFAETQNFAFYVVEKSLKFSVYMSILLLGVRMFVAELSESFHGISEKLLPGSMAGIDCAATYGFAPENTMMFGFLFGVLGQFLAILGLVVFRSPVLVITGFVPVFFDNATIACFANKRGGIRAVAILTFASGLIQVLGAAFAAGFFRTASYGGWYGNFDFEGFWPWAGVLFKYAGYIGLAAVILFLLAIPQLQYRRNKEGYFEIATDYEAVKARKEHSEVKGSAGNE